MSRFDEIADYLNNKIPADDKTREYERTITKYALQNNSKADIEVFNTLMGLSDETAYKAFFCLATIYRRNRDYSKLRTIIENAEANSVYRAHVSLRHIRIMYETHSESIYDYDELLSLAHESACELFDNAGYQHTFANAFATICENCLQEDLPSIIREWYDSALFSVNRAIELEPDYAKFYSTKARIVSLQNKYEEANSLILKAIDLEDSSKSDYALLVGNYQYYRIMIAMKKQKWLLGNTYYERNRETPAFSTAKSGRFDVLHRYAFVSYSHNDAQTVYSIISKLRNHGINVWYDGELAGGSEWTEEIGRKLAGSEIVVVMLSQMAILSKNVRNEITMALNHQKTIIPVFIEEVELSPGAELQLQGYHSYYYYMMSEELFTQKILSDLEGLGLERGHQTHLKNVTESKKVSQVRNSKDIDEQGVTGVHIIEQLCESKTGIPEQNEDIIIRTPDFIAVIDGATSKTGKKMNGRTGGRIVAEFLESYIKSEYLPKNIDGRTAVSRLQAAIRAFAGAFGYEEQGVHLCASAVIYSVSKRQIWAVGDCQFMINGQLFTFYKKVDQILSEARALAIHMLLNAGHTEQSLMEDDQARGLILGELKMQQYLENKRDEYGYSVLSSIGEVRNVFIRDVLPGSEVVLASDGYPVLHETLEDSERHLEEIIRTDPLCYKENKSTKGLTAGNRYFDDRSFIRFIVNA